MIVVPPPGEFRMSFGVSNDNSIDTRIDRSFSLAAKEVTVAEFLLFRKEHQFPQEYSPTDDCPMQTVSWYAAAEYCNWLSEQEGRPREQWCFLPNSDGYYADGMTLAPDYLIRTGYRLPTEAEWYSACQAGAETEYSFGESKDPVEKHAWIIANSLGRTHPVGSLRPNDLGLFDMHGNVWEWCADWYSREPPGGFDPLGTSTASLRVIRSSSWDEETKYCSTANRNTYIPSFQSSYLGFRVAAFAASNLAVKPSIGL